MERPKYDTCTFENNCVLLFNYASSLKGATGNKAILVDLDEFFINLSKSAAFSLQTSENILKPP